MTADEFFAPYPESKTIFEALAAALASVGPCEMRATKSQVAFRRQRAFAWAWVPAMYLGGSRPPLVVSVALRRRDPSSRWKQVVEPSRGRFMHHMELDGVAAVDEELIRWLAEAWRDAGQVRTPSDRLPSRG